MDSYIASSFFFKTIHSTLDDFDVTGIRLKFPLPNCRQPAGQVHGCYGPGVMPVMLGSTASLLQRLSYTSVSSRLLRPVWSAGDLGSQPIGLWTISFCSALSVQRNLKRRCHPPSPVKLHETPSDRPTHVTGSQNGDPVNARRVR